MCFSCNVTFFLRQTQSINSRDWILLQKWSLLPCYSSCSLSTKIMWIQEKLKFIQFPSFNTCQFSRFCGASFKIWLNKVLYLVDDSWNVGILGGSDDSYLFGIFGVFGDFLWLSSAFLATIPSFIPFPFVYLPGFSLFLAFLTMLAESFTLPLPKLQLFINDSTRTPETLLY